MTDDELKEAVKLANDSIALWNAHPQILENPAAILARAVLHLTERLRLTEAVCEAAWEAASNTEDSEFPHRIQRLMFATKAWREGK